MFQVKVTGRKLVDIFLQEKNYNVHVKVYVKTWLLLRYCFRGLLDSYLEGVYLSGFCVVLTLVL